MRYHPLPVSASAESVGDTLESFLAPLTDVDEASAQPGDEAWERTIERISDSNRVAEITEDTWLYFFEVLPPKILRGRWFGFAEGQEPLRIFFVRDGRCFCRQLTEEQSVRVCELTVLPKDYGA